MSDSIMHQQDGFIVLEPNKQEFLTYEELLEKLKNILSDRQDDLPRELQNIKFLESQAKYLMENFCDLEMGPDTYLQWYVVRLEK
ncbi:chlororespiratory reduction protein 7 [Candidatus Atelocyanobacterium thalassae]|uniref:Chlororespiratory reduction protein 7 n=1 Tax=cyanobacterium endosymbiont of Braarudosphaera bigelowii TaxID=1285375 RepID=A0ABM7U3S4_9CHRO|nr:chlororespiratory reduction protein 7 [Candidatus Atelocyanobacterium thalassa]BDA39271.1 hypothetical protein CPARK_000011000 [cyanobacterium endosymbiont of Braarudosphaera bigelowii]